MKTMNFLILTLFILLIPVIMLFSIIGLHSIFGQTATTTEGLQPLPQDYYIITQLPKGISVAATEQQSTGLDGLDIAGILALVGSGAAYVKGHLVGKKADKTEETTKEQSAQIVQSKEVEKSIANTMFKLAPAEKVQEVEGTIPEIKQEKLAQDKEEALNTASKA